MLLDWTLCFQSRRVTSSSAYGLYIAAHALSAAICKQPLPGRKKNVVFLLPGKQWEVKHRRGGMEGDEYPFLGLILLSGVAISVFWPSPRFPVVYASVAKPRGSSLSWIFAMLVWQGCRYIPPLPPWSRSHHGRGRKHNAL